MAALVTSCGADDWESAWTFGMEQKSWLRIILNLLNSIHSHNTFSQIFR